MKKYIVPAIVPLLSILYGLADTYGWTDRLTGRTQAIAGLHRLTHGNGYPVTFITANETEFCPLIRYINKNSRNPQIGINNSITNPSTITIDGGLTRKGPTPVEWPVNVDTPESSHILVIYGQDPNNSGGMATWAGSVLEVRQWIESSRNRERFWVSVFAVSFLSIWIGTIKAKKNG